MPNHVHILAECEAPGAFATALRGVHAAYARRINAREGATGHLWQERFYSCQVEPQQAWKVARYILRNPVRAALARAPQGWAYSSIHGHLGNAVDPIISESPLRDWIRDWSTFLEEADSHAFGEELRKCTHGRAPFGSATFVKALEERVGRRIRLRPRGRPRKGT